MGDWSGSNTLRNTIAHSRWTDGDRPGSIKPRGLDIRQGHARFVGESEQERSYTAGELNTALAQLASVNERLKRFLQVSALEQIILSKMETR